MERRIPRAGDIYRHFKGRKYRILYIATCTETGEDMVIFEAAEGTHKVYASALETFLRPFGYGKISAGLNRNTVLNCAGISEKVPRRS